MECFLFILCLHLFVIPQLGLCSNEEVPFHNYDISQLIKLSSNEENGQQQFQLHAFENNFVFAVRKTEAPLHPKFKLLVGNEEDTSFHSNNEYFEGFLIDEPNTRVIMIKSSDNSVFGSIELEHDSIHFEPANMHFPNYEERELVVYKSSSVNWKPILDSLEKHTRPKIDNDMVSVPKKQLSKERILAKRQLFDGPERLNRCPIKVVADYKFFSSVGRRQHSHTYRYIVNMVSQVNEIFRRVDWDEGENIDGLGRGRFTNMGIQIKEIRILDRPTHTPGHYNSYSPNGKNSTVHWNSTSLLNAFAKSEGSEKFCLVHLLTAQSFGQDERVLGIAYVGNPRSNDAGVCGTHPFGKVYNALLTTAINGGSPLASKGHEIVVAHEYGHTWGASHDNDTDPVCSPSFEDGGKYIMDEFGQSGLYPNNVIFSACSKKAIRNILNTRWKRCFEEERFSFCGNGVLEFGEECDEGSEYGVHNSTCCTKNCRLIPGAICSPINKPCCNMNCAFHPATHICESRNDWQCKMESFCNGKTADCPDPLPVRDGIKCAEEGQCHDGYCTPYCERHNKTSCICEDVNLSCLRCCRETNGMCAPQLGAKDLPDGTTCIKGTCIKSKCVSEATDYVLHFWQNIQDNERRWHYLKSNLVGIVVIVMTIIWCSFGRLILIFDERMRNAVVKANNVDHVECQEYHDFGMSRVYPASPTSAPSETQMDTGEFDGNDILGLDLEDPSDNEQVQH